MLVEARRTPAEVSRYSRRGQADSRRHRGDLAGDRGGGVDLAFRPASGRRLLVGQGLPSSSIVYLSLQIRRISRHNFAAVPSKVDESTGYFELTLPRCRDLPSTCGVTPG
jgi:hypothetical protein